LRDAPASNVTHPNQFRGRRIESFPAAVVDALTDDLNTPEALAAMHGIVSEMNGTNDPDRVRALHDELIAGGWLLGLLTKTPEAHFKTGAALDTAEIERRIEARNAARAARDFALADQIRNQLLEQGIELEDSRDGTRWKMLR
jgi:cysteinyl-tRNA synthetase